jgi:hypothetical protein
MRDQPWFVLARHFFSALFDFGSLSDAGAESFKRALLGLAAIFASLGLLLARVFLKKYRMLSQLGDVAPYELAVITDHAFLMALAMWIVAIAVTLVGHALFPDEADYRILMSQPVSRRAVFAGKLAALLTFAGLFVVGIHVALLPLFVLTLLNRLAEAHFVAAVITYVVSSVAASAFAALAIVAVHGVLMLAAPRGRLATLSTMIRSGLVCSLVLALPLIARLPAASDAVRGGASWMPLAPPMWFVGLERSLLGGSPWLDPSLATFAIVALFSVAAVSAVSYAILYRHFDRVTLRAQPSRRPMAWRRFLPVLDARRPARAGVRMFATLTLRRSVLHQGIFVACSAVAAGLVLNTLLSNSGGLWRAPRLPRSQMIGLLMSAPFVLIFVMSRAVRLAIAVPIEPRANWIFRMTEADATRADVIGAGVLTVVLLGVALPAAVILPFQWLVVGPHAIVAAVVTLLIGWLHAEWLMRDWRIVTFTCSYLPGKGFIPHMFLKGFLFFVGFTAGGAFAVRAAITVPAAAIVIAAVVFGTACALAARRRSQSRDYPLAFEDELPTELNVLRLNAD